MSLLFHATNFVKVNRHGDTVTAECTLLSNAVEAVAWVDASVQTLQISRAGWANYRSSAGETGVFDLPALIGVEAYITGGPALRKVLGGPGLELPYDLISECFRGVLQAETYFFLERGFVSAKQYDDFCEQHSIGACRFYSHLEETELQWTEWLGSTERDYNLFNRCKTVSITQQAVNASSALPSWIAFTIWASRWRLTHRGGALCARQFYQRPGPDLFSERCPSVQTARPESSGNEQKRNCCPDWRSGRLQSSGRPALRNQKSTAGKRGQTPIVIPNDSWRTSRDVVYRIQYK
jgi:hypothetical protein